ncbi:Hsp20/alpha crystallin family protein [Candidatus Nitronereus thalassa]|uniref:Hsp20/alpha crystallin family protein n=1 Tax=Candidatus Nitronereus thalassa TaxID=3020898 RepID=A0ABU3KA77_9BACT|nr:Hsp20/alpha crystallin family protein [Candidatus Nitronereus thalassa]MDT7043364.1 Hsp20/alpha crystallin family protein [Candidatus Nitronereus thalassa]
MTTRILTPFETQVDRLFSDAVRSLGAQAREYAPACNVWEDMDHFGVELALPGWKSNEVTIEAENGFVTVEGKKQEQVAEENKEEKSYHVREIQSGSFSRSFRLPTNLEWDQANASFADGVLTIAFPKRADAKPRRIAIQ